MNGCDWGEVGAVACSSKFSHLNSFSDNLISIKARIQIVANVALASVRL